MNPNSHSVVVPAELPLEIAEMLAREHGWTAGPTPPSFEEGSIVDPGISEDEAKDFLRDGAEHFRSVWVSILAALPAGPAEQAEPPHVIQNRALEHAAKIAENWGNAPPNPTGRRAALAYAIRSLKVAEPSATEDGGK